MILALLQREMGVCAVFLEDSFLLGKKTQFRAANAPKVVLLPPQNESGLFLLHRAEEEKGLSSIYL